MHEPAVASSSSPRRDALLAGLRDGGERVTAFYRALSPEVLTIRVYDDGAR